MFRSALRTLRRSPGFTVIALLTLAVGIGANTAIFSFINGVLLKPLPYQDADRILMVWEKTPRGGRNTISTLTFLDWKNQNSVFEYMAAANWWSSMTMTGSGQPEELNSAHVSAHYFDIFKVQAGLGRTFAPDEDQPGKSQVAILSHKLWQTRFGGDPNILGRVLTLNGKPHTVIGVLPARSPFERFFAQIWVPLAFEPKDMTRDYHWMMGYARLKPGVTLEKAQAQMDAIGGQIAQNFPASNKGWGVKLDRFADQLVRTDLRNSLYVLLAAVGAILLIGCANLANLELARGTARGREMAVRASLGAGRARLIRYLLAENLLLSVLGGILGLGLGYGMMRGLQWLTPPYSLPGEADVSIDTTTLLFTLGVSVLTAILFGLLPAFQSSRVDLSAAMKDGGRSSSSGVGHAYLRNALIVSEVALAFVLLSGAGLLIGSFFNRQRAETGFDSTNVTTARLPVARDRFTQPVQMLNYLRQLEESVHAVPGVRDVAFSNVLPMQGWADGMWFQIVGHPFVDRTHRPSCFFKRVTPSYFRTLQIPVLRGRGLSEQDGRGAAPALAINQTMAERYFPGEDPIGKRILIQELLYGQPGLGPEIAWEVVGIVGDELTGSLGEKADQGVYVTYAQSPTNSANVVVRASMNPELLTSSLTAAIHSVNKMQPVADVMTLDKIKSTTIAEDSLRTTLLAVFAGAALLLASIGIYGVISYSVTQRTHELGIRSALGANRTGLLALVIRQGMAVVLAGWVLGALLSLAITRLLSSLLFGVSPHNPLVLISVSGLLLAVAAFACYMPARRAANIDPIVALRYE